jgi:NAD(P)-dependent dehydrogenase (short-subunit alcohol dehydrogenase family)
VKRVLILGGYGGFGSRLSRRLASDGFEVLVAGRDANKAEAFAASLPHARGVVADRNGDIAALLSTWRPAALIDAAGPFQGSGYHVAEACIGAGVDYLDLADARDFVTGIGQLDASARAAGVRIFSGASSVPALSGAVLRHLCDGLDSVDMVEIAISASNRATAGPSVASAILSYAGKPLCLWCGQRWQRIFGWSEKRRMHFAVDGLQPINRLVALADVPDHDLVPGNLVGKPAMTFYAGPEFAFQLRAIAALGWLVRLGWLRSLSSLARWLLPLQRLTNWAGSDRSAMQVEAKGRRGNQLLTARWTLIAEKGDGPEIPVLAAQLLMRRLADDSLPMGACDASGLLSLKEFEPLFDKLAIRHQSTQSKYRALYARIMGNLFDALPPTVRVMHSIVGDGGATGRATVTRGSNILAKLIANIMRFPPAGNHRLHVHFTERDGAECWTRDFSGHRFSSHLSQSGQRLVERFGPMRFHFDLSGDENRLRMQMQRWTAFGLPMPLFLGPKSDAREWGEGDRFHFDVPISLPLIGTVIHYRGWLNKS